MYMYHISMNGSCNARNWNGVPKMDLAKGGDWEARKETILVKVAGHRQEQEQKWAKSSYFDPMLPTLEGHVVTHTMPMATRSTKVV